MATNSFGLLTQFDHQTQDWISFISRLEQWFIANDVTTEIDKLYVKRRAILLSALSGPTYMLARDLALPNKLEETSYGEITKLLGCHFEPKRLGFAEKSIFYAAVQRSDESHTQWAARIRGLAAHCGFKNLEEALLDKFIMGMVHGHERDKLFAQDQAVLTLSKAVELAESVRCARRASTKTSVATPLPTEPVFVVSHKEKCSVCGYSNHKSNQCRFKNYKCKKCNRKGHLRRMCTEEKVKHIEEGNVDEEDDGKSCFNIRCEIGKPMRECVSLNGQLLEFEIDSGSAVSIITEQIYNLHFNKTPLSATKKKLLSYTGGQIDVIGCITLEISYKDSTQSLDMFVVRSGGPPLLGRDFISQFNLQLTTAVKSIKMQDSADEIIINNLVSRYPKVFSGELGRFNKFEVELQLKPDAKPIFFKARSVPYALKEKIDAELDRLVNLGVLEPIQYSDYASPIVPALKKDGGIRICADFSVTINKQLLIDKYPLPTVDDLFAKLHGGVQFSKLDLSMAYNQFVLNKKSQSLTCINTHRGLFKYTRMVFGLSSAPAIFQRAMECVLAGLEGVIFFLDDILVTGNDKTQHKQRLMAVLQRLEETGLTIQKSKCEFFKNEVNYLGHIIDKSGIRKSPEKIRAVIEAPQPKNVSQLQSFLGLANYYRNFIPDASIIMSPLYFLLHKNVQWEWTAQHKKAFNKIKNILASEKVLTHFDPTAKLILTVDAGPNGLGAILSQISKGDTERPICYASRTLTTAEKNYAQIQKEATAIIFGVRRFHQYLYGKAQPFVLRTDHKPLLTIFGPHHGIPEVSANRLQRYAIFLSAYNYVIEYVRSKENSADFLSRAPVLSQAHKGPSGDAADARGVQVDLDRDRTSYVNFVIEGSLPITLHDLKTETARDPVLRNVIQFVQYGWPKKNYDTNLKVYHSCRYQLSFDNGCLMRGHKVVIPLKFREKMCNELHSSHFGIVKMKAEARKRFWYPGIDKDLERLAGSCLVCSALRPAPPHAPLAPWPHPPHAFHRVHLDFLGPFQGQMYLIAVDAYSKWVECYFMTTSYGSKAVIEKLYDLMSRFGVPHTLVTDNGSSFISEEFKSFCNLNAINHLLTPAYHPSSNGQAESMVKLVKKGLKTIMLNGNNKKSLKEKVAKFLYDYRNSKNCTTGKSPAELLYGRTLRSRLDILCPQKASTSSTDLTRAVERNQFLQAKYYKGVNRREFEEGESVWITKNLTNKKFKWIEAIIIKKTGKVTYLVHVPEMNCTVTRHMDQIRVKGSSSSKANYSWDLDVVPDLQPFTTTSESTSFSEENKGGSGPSGKKKEEQGHSKLECGQAAEFGLDSASDYESESPPPGPNPRRVAITPEFTTPPVVQSDEDDTWTPLIE